MPKLCQKCHKNPAVVHFRAYGSDGRHSTVSYCLSCAMKMSQEEDTPEELRQMLQGMMKDLKKDFPEELVELQEQEGDSEEGVSLAEFFEGLKSSHSHGKSSGKEKSKSLCPCCHRDFSVPPQGNALPMKCGHCLTTLRGELHEHAQLDFFQGRVHSAESLGMPIFCGKNLIQEKNAPEPESRRLVSLLKRYHGAVATKNSDGAELLKEELNCLRRNLTEEMRRHATPASCEDVLDFLSLPSLGDVELRDEFWRYGWLPSAGDKGAQIRLSSGVLFYRTIVDWRMPKDASAAEYHRRLAEFLWQDPIFEGGQWIPEDNSLSTKNRRLVIDCGNDAYCAQRAFHFEGQFFGKPGEGGMLLKHLRSFLRRLEHRCTFFTDPEFGFYSPRKEALGSCIYPVEYLHLPALCMLEGDRKLQKAIQALDPSGCSDDMPTILMVTPEGIPEYGDVNHSEAIGLVMVVDTRAAGTPLRERVQTLNRVAKFLEKEEQQARRRLKANIFRHKSAEDLFARSLALLRNARLLSQQEAVLAISRVWLGVEVGSISSVSKEQLFQAARFALMQDADYQNPMFARRYARTPVPAVTAIDYTKLYLEDLDDLGEVLWEDQNPDIALPASKASKDRSAEDPLGLGEVFQDILENPLAVLEKLRGALERTHSQVSAEELLEQARLRAYRSFAVRDAMKKKSADEFGVEGN